MVLFCVCVRLLCVHCLTYLPIYCSKCVWQYFRSLQMSARICADICSLLQCLIFSKSKMSAQVRNKKKKKTKSEFYTSFCGRPQANLHRAVDVRKKIAPADTEKCLQKSAGFDRGTDICGFVADICWHTPTSAMIYAEVRICPQHMPDLLRTLMVRVRRITSTNSDSDQGFHLSNWEWDSWLTRPKCYKTFFMLNLAKHEIFPANKSQITNNCKFCLAEHIVTLENFSANKYDNTNRCWYFHIY